METKILSTHSQQCEDEDPMVLEWLISLFMLFIKLLNRN